MLANANIFGIDGGMAVLIVTVIVLAIAFWGLNNLLQILDRRPRH